ncbi:hypothetical protein NE237_019925 [Protea cynaroides]|uniref:Uncharacterized protein n=1 Tax=Protea cynaroides TaxID=273540 RepID=A0A9Q0H691_9MAGN|nr:hypothetical protein NE237_019925 [Protea cynaroides]
MGKNPTSGKKDPRSVTDYVDGSTVAASDVVDSVMFIETQGGCWLVGGKRCAGGGDGRRKRERDGKGSIVLGERVRSGLRQERFVLVEGDEGMHRPRDSVLGLVSSLWWLLKSKLKAKRSLPPPRRLTWVESSPSIAGSFSMTEEFRSRGPLGSIGIMPKGGLRRSELKIKKK